MLRNGNILAGKIQRQTDLYRIELASGELLVRAEQVDMFCQSLDEAYERRRLGRTGSSADSHVELARWCLRHELLEYASRELLDARTIEPDHRQLPLVERQLQLALRNRETQSEFEPVVETKTTPTQQDVEAEEDVPDWARKLFVRQIQPLLVDSCAASGCHHMGSSESFQLNRLAVEGAGHPKTTLRNLSATLAELDLNSPSESRLLVHAKQAHGANGSKQPRPLKRHQYQMLLTWVEQLALVQKNSQVQGIELANHLDETAVGTLPLVRHAFEHSEKRANDPFDPERFNSRFGTGVDAKDRATASHSGSD